MNLRNITLAAGLAAALSLAAQSPRDQFEAFKAQQKQNFVSFRDECNNKYADFLAKVWDQVNVDPAIPKPKEEPPVPPVPYEDKQEEKETPAPPIEVKPKVLPTPSPAPIPQPQPVAPVEEEPMDISLPVKVRFYGILPQIRIPDFNLSLGKMRPEDVAAAWKKLSSDSRLNNTIRDCLEARKKYGMSDWAYLQFLENLAKQTGRDSNESTFLMAYLFCQSGYQMRLAQDAGELYMLFGSRHVLFETPRYVIGGINFYPYGKTPEQLNVANTIFEGETPMSFILTTEQKLGDAMSEKREIKSKRYSDISIVSQVPTELLKFYDSYPDSKYGDNFMTQWAIYANTPMAESTKKQIYPSLQSKLDGLSKKEKVEKLLNLIQTGFKYELDENVWGEERAFFAEETLYYPFCDCEDRSILFSRLVRDLVGLDVALVYYPGHLAAAVCFDEPVTGDSMTIGGRKFVIADPTYINAPVGKQMPNLDYAKAEAILLNR